MLVIRKPLGIDGGHLRDQSVEPGRHVSEISNARALSFMDYQTYLEAADVI